MRWFSTLIRVALQRGRGQRRAAGLALRCLVLQPPAQVLVEPLVRDRSNEFAALRALLVEPGLCLVHGVEGLGPTDSLAVRPEPEVDPCHEPLATRTDAATALAGATLPPPTCHGVTSTRSLRVTVSRSAEAIGSR
jgi:hypothetical protein